MTIAARVGHNPQPEMSFELKGGWAIDLFGVRPAPYSLSVTSVIKSVAELPSIRYIRYQIRCRTSFVKKNCFFADILLHLFT